MAQTLVLNDKHKVSRRKRFSAFTSDSMIAVFSEVGQKIVEHHRRFAAETRSANVAIAYFSKYCLNLTDRGVVFGIIHELIRKYDLAESGFPRRYKLEFLQLLASHEHWIPINLPILLDSNAKPIFKMTDQIGSEGKKQQLNV